MRLFKNKFFVIALAIALVLTTCTTVLSVMGVASPLRSVLGAVALPFRWCAAKVAQGLAGFSAYFTEFDRLREENSELSREVAELRQRLADAERMAEENAALREFFGLESLEVEWELVDAVVIGREAGGYMAVYTLNRGSLHGIERGMAVVSADGVVGYVKETGISWCKVVPITETTSALGAHIEKSGISGLVVGDFELRDRGRCKMTYIENGEGLSPGDFVVTSGTGGIYPAGLPVGVVEEVVPDPLSRTYTATIIPAADFDNLTRVMIITSYSITKADETQHTEEESLP
ncbi:MAG TPA: rod shape-determining protein MreC [Clostridiales bacterium]|jgi:rod shape-determining protein MreC|nr:rod shape-determining protein MreC [Clostridiales bacterium]